MSRRRWRGRVLLAGSLGAFVAAAFLACQGDAVVIGIESDAGPSVLRIIPVGSAVPPPLGGHGQDAAALPIADPTILDAGSGECFPDGGCPPGKTCVYPVDAACGAPGECFFLAPLPPPPPNGPGALTGGAEARRLPEGYSLGSSACAEPSPQDAAASDADPGDARGD
jgi:hypothetical protein